MFVDGWCPVPGLTSPFIFLFRLLSKIGYSFLCLSFLYPASLPQLADFVYPDAFTT